MNISGFMQTTLLDYPGKLACTVFTPGCNFRCPFCQNGSLVLQTEVSSYSEEEIFRFLKKRRNILEGICITGGEPTLQPDLADFIRNVKDLGYAVKLDTNGFRPEVLSDLLREQLLDYVAMDIKASIPRYGVACGIPDMDTSGIERSIDLLKSSGVSFEFRTTLVKGIHTLEDMDALASRIAPADRYFLQSYEESERILAKMQGINYRLSAFFREELQEFLLCAEKHIPGAVLRGVDND